jgi:hypothetical protein
MKENNRETADVASLAEPPRTFNTLALCLSQQKARK